MLDYSDFLKVDIRVGTIIKAEANYKLKNPSIILEIDFGEKIGVKKSSAQLVANYNVDCLINKQIAAVINFASKQSGNIMSEVLVLGGVEKDGTVRLLKPDPSCELGSRVG